MTNNTELIQHELVGSSESGEYYIRITNKPEFSHITFTLGGVKFIEGDDEANLQFEYDVIEGAIPEGREEQFKQLLGDFVVQAIEEGIKNNNLVYKGGVDEDRTNNIEQPGT